MERLREIVYTLNFYELDTTQVLYIASALLLLSGLFFFLFVIWSRMDKRRSAAKKAILVEKCQGFVSELVFEEELSSEARDVELFFLAKNRRKQLLLEEIMSLHKSLQGELAKFLEAYYIEKKLFKLSFNKIKSKKKHMVIEGLHELAEMNATGAVRSISKVFPKTKDVDTKSYFLEYMMKLDPEFAIDLILQTDTFLSDWFQVKVINILNETNFVNIPPLRSWIARGGSHAIFGCRLIAFTKAQNEIPDLIELLSDKEEALRLEALKTLAVLEAEEITDFLKARYMVETEIVKREILEVLSQFDYKSNVQFFSECSSSETPEIRLLAIKVINKVMKDKNFNGMPSLYLHAYNPNSTIKLVG